MMIKRNYLFFLILLVLPVIFQGCGTTGSGDIFTEKSIAPNDVVIRTVAILPNRLPITLRNPEKWREFNYRVLKRNFEKKGYRVIDYMTASQAFAKSGLPLEDTKSSRDKYAEIAEELNADLLIFPYYATQFQIRGVLQTHEYIAIGSLQFYYAGDNDFLSRIDFEGINYYSSGGYLIALLPVVGGVVGGIIGAVEDAPLIGTIIAMGATLISVILPIIPELTPVRKRYERAYVKAINRSLELFFMKYSAASSGSSSNNKSSANSEVEKLKAEVERLKLQAELDELKKAEADRKAEQTNTQKTTTVQSEEYAKRAAAEKAKIAEAKAAEAKAAAAKAVATAEVAKAKAAELKKQEELEAQKKAEAEKKETPPAKVEEKKKVDPVVNNANLIDLNSTTKKVLKGIEGVNGTIADRVIRFRDLLGGFVNESQLAEVDGVDNSLAKLIGRAVNINAANVSKINISYCSSFELSKHPYIRSEVASAIISYRDKNGKFTSVADIKKVSAVNEELYLKIVPYLTVP